MLREPEQVKQNVDLCYVSVIDKVLLAKTLSEAIRKRNLEKVEEIGDITPKKKKPVYGLDLNYLLCQVLVATAAEINANVSNQGGEIKSSYNSFWNERCVNWSKEEFKQRIRMSRKKFDFLLTKINAQIEKIPTEAVTQRGSVK